MDTPSEIYLARPNGQKEGPFSLDQINVALAAGKYRSGDYWAWHKGLPEWVPLYDIDGIIKVSSLAASLATEAPERTSSAEEESPQATTIQDLPEDCAAKPLEGLAAGEPPATEAPAELSNPSPQDFVPVDSGSSEVGTPETEHEESQPELTAVQNPDPEASQADETIEETSPVEQEPVEENQTADCDPETTEATEPLSANDTSHLSKDQASELVDKSETAASILARLKQNFLHASEPANGVTSYFNARRAPLPGGAGAGTPQLGSEFGMPEAAHPLDFHSKAVPKDPADSSSTGPDTDPAVALLAQQFSSGMPFVALEQLFIFTTGDGRSIWSSQTMSRMLQAIVGEKMERIRESVPRDVIFNCDPSQLLKRDGAISDAVWHAMAIREPSVVMRAQKKLSRTCVRTFNLETDIVVALVLFYNNQKLESTSPILRTGSADTTRFSLPVSAGSPDSQRPQ